MAWVLVKLIKISFQEMARP